MVRWDALIVIFSADFTDCLIRKLLDLVVRHLVGIAGIQNGDYLLSIILGHPGKLDAAKKTLQ